MNHEELQAARATFANETGYTAEEWLALWRAGQIDTGAPGAAERYEHAVDLESKGW